MKLLLSFILCLAFFGVPATEVAEDARSIVAPYLLPEGHPVISKLDRIFAKKRPIHDLRTLRAAGFKFYEREKWDQIIVAKHPKLKGYLLKLYTDSQIGVPDWPMWIQRIEGARLIQHIIDQHGYQHLFKTPQKWIYPIPVGSNAAPDTDEKHFILVVEDMHLLDSFTIRGLWATQEYMSEERLAALHTILREGGLIDSVFVDNVPITEDTRMAFIDTEHYNKGPVDFMRLLRFLHPARQSLWRKLVE